MARKITIGRTGNQPFQLNDPKVGREHAYLIINDNGTLQLIDNNSTNGTHIYNGRFFVRLLPHETYDVTPDTMIQLGTDTRFHIRRLLAQSHVGPQVSGGQQPGAIHQGGNQGGGKKTEPPRVDISHLKKVSDRYLERKMQLESKSSMVNGLRSLTIIISLAIGTVGMFIADKVRESLGDEIAGYVPIISFGVGVLLMLILLLIINVNNKKIKKAIMDNDQNYAIKYVCPKCHVSFRGKFYENILAERACPKCKAQYFDKNEPS